MCYSWAAFRQAIHDICDNGKALKEDADSVKYFQHIGGGHYVVTAAYVICHRVITFSYALACHTQTSPACIAPAWTAAADLVLTCR